MPRNTLSEFDKKLREEISDNLKKYTKGLTQAELSDMTGIPTSTLSGYFSKRSTINAGNTQKIADALGINKQDIDPRFKENVTFSHEEGENETKLVNSINLSLNTYLSNKEITNLDIKFLQLYFDLDIETRSAVYSFLKTTLPKQQLSKSSSEINPLIADSVTNTPNICEFATTEEAEEAYKKSRLNSASKTASSVTNTTNDKSKEQLKVVK